MPSHPSTQLEDMSFSVQPATQEGVTDELVDEVADAFMARAKQLSGSLGDGSPPRIESAHLNTRTPSYHSRIGGGMAFASMAEDFSSPPTFEEGTSEVSVSMSGTVLLSDNSMPR